MIKNSRKDWNSNREDWDSNKEDGDSTIRIMAICHKKIHRKKISNLSLKIICDKKNYGCKLVKLGPSRKNIPDHFLSWSQKNILLTKEMVTKNDFTFSPLLFLSLIVWL